MKTDLALQVVRVSEEERIKDLSVINFINHVDQI